MLLRLWFSSRSQVAASRDTRRGSKQYVRRGSRRPQAKHSSRRPSARAPPARPSAGYWVPAALWPASAPTLIVAGGGPALEKGQRRGKTSILFMTDPMHYLSRDFRADSGAAAQLNGPDDARGVHGLLVLGILVFRSRTLRSRGQLGGNRKLLWTTRITP